jgi:hypothetical protein
MIPKLFAIHAVMFAFVIFFLVSTDFGARAPSSLPESMPESMPRTMVKY